MSTPKALQLPSGVQRLTIETARGKFAALQALPPSGVCERQPALLVPGYTGSKEDFLLILQALAAAGRQVVAIDMRGQFETPGADDPAAYQLDALAADVTMLAGWLGEGHGASSGLASVVRLRCFRLVRGFQRFTARQAARESICSATPSAGW